MFYKIIVLQNFAKLRIPYFHVRTTASEYSLSRKCQGVESSVLFHSLLSMDQIKGLTSKSAIKCSYSVLTREVTKKQKNLFPNASDVAS